MTKSKKLAVTDLRTRFLPGRFRRTASAEVSPTGAATDPAPSPTSLLAAVAALSPTAVSAIHRPPSPPASPPGGPPAAGGSAGAQLVVEDGVQARSNGCVGPDIAGIGTKEVDAGGLGGTGETGSRIDGTGETASSANTRDPADAGSGSAAVSTPATVRASNSATTSAAPLEATAQGSISSTTSPTRNTRTTTSPTKPLPQLPTATSLPSHTSSKPELVANLTDESVWTQSSTKEERGTDTLDFAHKSPTTDTTPEENPSRAHEKLKREPLGIQTTDDTGLNAGLRDLTDEGLDSRGHRRTVAEGQSHTEGHAETVHTNGIASRIVHDLDEPLSPTTPAPAATKTLLPQLHLLEASPPPPESLTQPGAVRAADLGSYTISPIDDPERAIRAQSLALPRDYHLVRSLLQAQDQHQRGTPGTSPTYASFGHGSGMALERPKMHRKIWVKRAGASATLVQIAEDDLVDDVRDMILKKYANSLGRSFDSPDVTLRIVAREHSHSHRHAPPERVLGPEEHMTRTLDAFYPGGQTVDEALLIDVPVRRTPRLSPHVPLMPYYSAAVDDLRPAETDQGYFPLVQPGALPSPQPAGTAGSTGAERPGHQHHHSISVLNSGHVPLLPSPGSRASRQGHRPWLGRNNTSSPTSVAANPSLPDQQRLHTNAPNPPPLPTPPAANQPQARTATPPPRTQSPRPTKQKRPAKKNSTIPQPGGLLDGTVPPINVLIVEDNIINLKLLEAFMKRLKVRWHTAMNGRDAVTKWKEGGFHLVLMDIQLPIMSGLEATKEIRRLERCNHVGVLAADEEAEADEASSEKDKLANLEMFKSSVIIVALTASSLQSDRHEALAAGCNDFLTKPVNFVWLERKVTEWGCMQALIDFDGWRRWKAPATPAKPTTKPEAAKKTSPSGAILSPPGAVPSPSAITHPNPPRAAAGSSSSDSSAFGAAINATKNTAAPPGLHIQAPTPPPATPAAGITTNSTPPKAAPPADPGSNRRPSPLQQTSTATSSPPPLDTAAPAAIDRTSPSPSRMTRDRAGASPWSGNSPTMVAAEGWGVRDRELGRRQKRSNSGLGVSGLSGVQEEEEGPGHGTREREREKGGVDVVG